MLSKARIIEREPKPENTKAKARESEMEKRLLARLEKQTEKWLYGNGKNPLEPDAVRRYGECTHCVYIMTAGENEHIKIGFSAKPDERRRQLQIGQSRPIMILWGVRVKPRDAIGIEAEIHKQLRGGMYHCLGEWYRMSPETAKAMILREIEKRDCDFKIDATYGLGGVLGSDFALMNGARL